MEEHKNSNNSPYKFNAKELDAETGNYYYGARYYNPKWSFWLSVDPLAEKYPGWNPYNYTLQNPIRFIDPDGRSVNNCTGCPDNGVLGDVIEHPDYGTLVYNGNYWENSNQANVLDEIVVNAEGGGGSDSGNNLIFAPYGIDGPDGTSIWSPNGWQNMGLHIGKSSVSINAGELNILGGNPTGVGSQSKFSAILGVIATILVPTSDWIGGNDVYEKLPEKLSEPKVTEAEKRLNFTLLKYKINIPPAKNLSIWSQDTLISPKEKSIFIQTNHNTQNQIDSLRSL